MDYAFLAWPGPDMRGNMNPDVQPVAHIACWQEHGPEGRITRKLRKRLENERGLKRSCC